jgi:hypothetical protein
MEFRDKREGERIGERSTSLGRILARRGDFCRLLARTTEVDYFVAGAKPFSIFPNTMVTRCSGVAFSTLPLQLLQQKPTSTPSMASSVPGAHHLLMGLGGKLRGVGLECLLAIATAEVDLPPIKGDVLLRIAVLPRHGAGGILGILDGGRDDRCRKTDCQQGCTASKTHLHDQCSV